ncbi:DUF5133 domain-containing protein [Streptomyces lavendulocolor]|uniref:DUF5133 domain-containing protein n=1 Tax=Streptomyces lavendulocolor TaxID=67316 RepID=A0ABV2WE42_9ACTN
MPDPRHLRVALARFADVRITLLHREDPGLRRELEEISQALCAMTGTATIDDALPAADAMLARSSRRRPAPAGGAAAAGMVTAA